MATITQQSISYTTILSFAISLIIIIVGAESRELRPSVHGLPYQEFQARSPEMMMFFGEEFSPPTKKSPSAEVSNETTTSDSWWRGGPKRKEDNRLRQGLLIATVVCGGTGVVLLLAAAFLFAVHFYRRRSEETTVTANNNSNYSVSATATPASTTAPGTVYTRLVVPAYTAVRDEFRRRMGKANVTSLGGFDTCYNVPITIPSITFMFQGMNLSLPQDNFMLRSTSTSIACLAMAASPENVNSGLNIIANMQQQNHRVVFDVPNNRIGISRENCT